MEAVTKPIFLFYQVRYWSNSKSVQDIIYNYIIYKFYIFTIISWLKMKQIYKYKITDTCPLTLLFLSLIYSTQNVEQAGLQSWKIFPSCCTILLKMQESKNDLISFFLNLINDHLTISLNANILLFSSHSSFPAYVFVLT